MEKFRLVSDYRPGGDQPEAIEALLKGIGAGCRFQTLLGVTGSGKTFTMANVIEKLNKPVLVISHNKTLAAQLYAEFVNFFPDNAVEYFVSYYDYYQPEAYIPQTDTYIEKDSSINDKLDRLRLSATRSILERRDVIVVASVSCIYGLGSPEDYKASLLIVEKGEMTSREEIIRRLVSLQYDRNDMEFTRGMFRVRGDTIDIFPSYDETAFRIEMFGDAVENICEINPVTGNVLKNKERLAVYSTTHFITPPEKMKKAVEEIKKELESRLAEFRAEGKLLEAQRLEMRTKYDIEFLEQTGYCAGIENYSRHMSGREPGDRPACLIDYFGGDYLLIIDESHVTVPQLRAMYEGDRSRKEKLVEFGFRLPSALDNRPLKFFEIEALMPSAVLFVSATPGPYDLEKSGRVVEQIIRPTGLLDPEIIIKPVKGQVDDLIERIKERAGKKERVIVTTLTKKMAESLAEYLSDLNLRVRYLHSEIETLERVEILRDLRAGEFDVIIGINLLREGLDLPEVSLVAVLDADKEGFLRSVRSLFQVAGRAARNVGGQVILYADRMTDAIRELMTETLRRRALQISYNTEHGITPATIQKELQHVIALEDDSKEAPFSLAGLDNSGLLKVALGGSFIEELEKKMYEAAENLEFEKAAAIRDEIKKIKKKK